MKRPPPLAGLVDVNAAHLRTGVVASAPTLFDRCDVTIDSVTYTNVPKLDHYRPRNAERVQVLVAGGQMLVIGAVGNDATLTSAPAATVDRTGFPNGRSVWNATTALGYPTNGLLIVDNYVTAGRSTQRITLASTGGTIPRELVRHWGSGAAWSAWAEVSQRPLVSLEDDTEFNAFTHSTPAAGVPVVGTSFTPWGTSIKVTVGGDVLADGVTIGAIAYLGWELRTGLTVGSGTLVLGTDQRKRSVSARATAATSSLVGASRVTPVLDLLTPGTAYNIRTMHAVAGGTGTVRRREILVEPI